jgi:hypothetical protein
MKEELIPSFDNQTIGQELPHENVQQKTDDEAFLELREESLQRIRFYYRNIELKRLFPDFFGTEKEISKQVKQYLRDNNIDRKYLSHPVLVDQREVDELLNTPEFFNDQDFMIEVIRLDRTNVLKSGKILLSNHDYMARLLNEFGAELVFTVYNAIEDIKIDEEIALEGIKKYPLIIQTVLSRVRDERDFVIKAIDNNPSVFRYLPSYLRSVKEIFLRALNNGYCDIYDNIPQSFEDDKEINVLFAKNSLSTFVLSHKFDGDQSIIDEVFSRENIMKQLERNIMFIQHFPLSILENKQLMLEIQSKFPDADFYIKEMEKRYDKKFV